MIGLKAASKRSADEEAEKPFWISFSDLMTALMVLFLIVMAAALLSVTRGVRSIEAQERHRVRLIQSCMGQVADYTRTIPGVRLADRSVDFGPLARFDNNSSDLSEVQQEFLRRFIPRVLALARAPVCDAFLKQIVVEGFASQRGSYLHNLDLSTRRSERVLCALLRPAPGSELTDADRELIQQLFFVGGYSFNSAKKSDGDSRRIELRLDFYALKEKREIAAKKIDAPAAGFSRNDLRCPVDVK